MNVRLLRRIAKHIQLKPKEFDMHNYTGVVIKRGKSCGTTRCIAGWACELRKVRPNYLDYTDYFTSARHLLGLTDGQAQRLFMGDAWPRGYGKWNATAAQAAARIEHFIRTKGAE